MCRQGVVNTRQSGVFAAPFTSLSMLQRRRKCLPSLGSPGAGASCGKCTGLFYECWKTGMVGVAELCFLIRSILDPQMGRWWCAVNSNQLFKCEVRANTAVGFPLWMLRDPLLYSVVPGRLKTRAVTDFSVVFSKLPVNVFVEFLKLFGTPTEYRWQITWNFVIKCVAVLLLC